MVFEIGKLYLGRGEELPREPEQLVVAISGQRGGSPRREKDGDLDFFDAKGFVESMFRRLELEATFHHGQEPGLHPAMQAEMLIDGNPVGAMGRVHPRVAEVFDVSENTYLIEIDVERLLLLSQSLHEFHPLPRFPGIVRDMALVVDRDIPAQTLQQMIQGTPLVSEVSLFDVYTGPQVPSGKKSLAYRVVFQSQARTLTDDEVDRAQNKTLGRLRRDLGATMRN